MCLSYVRQEEIQYTLYVKSDFVLTNTQLKKVQKGFLNSVTYSKHFSDCILLHKHNNDAGETFFVLQKIRLHFI